MFVEKGKHYIVRCVQFNKNGRKTWVPTLGDRHSDPELGNPRAHYHIDYRFMSERFIAFMYDKGFDPKNIKVIGDVDGVLPLMDRRLKCYRSEFLSIRHSVFKEDCGSIGTVEYKDFEASMAKAHVVQKDGCNFCPHKGVPLDGAAPTTFGKTIVECPGHGLTWNLRTGKLYDRCSEYKGEA